MSTTYPLDTTGSASSNRIAAELHTVTYDNSRDYNFIIPIASPFFSDSLKISKKVGASYIPLTLGIDFQFGLHFEGASLAVAAPIYGAVVMMNVSADAEYSLIYQTLGGQWTLDLPTITQMAADIAKNPRALTWEQVANLPTLFNPVDHPWSFSDMVGQSQVVAAIEDIATAILTNAGQEDHDHARNLLNPHQTTKDQLGLSKVANYGPASAIDAIDGMADDAVITPRVLRMVLDSLGILQMAQVVANFQSHLAEMDNPHHTSKDQVDLGNVDNFPTATQNDILRNARVSKFVTLDQLITWNQINGCSASTKVAAPIPQGALLHSYCNSNYDRMGTYSDGKGGTYESVIQVKDETCGYITNVPIANPPAGTVLSQYCSGTTLMGLKADGSGGVFSDVIRLTATECSSGTVYPPQGTVIATNCEGNTLVRTIANGSGGTTFDRVDNSSECVKTAYPPSGTLLSYACVGFDVKGTYADGSGGTYIAVMERNSKDCGYVAATTPPAQTFAPAGTIIGYSCSGFNRQAIKANGTGGTYNETTEINSVQCGYSNTPAPTAGPTVGTIYFSTDHTTIYIGDTEVLTVYMSGWAPNKSYTLLLLNQSPALNNNTITPAGVQPVLTTDSTGSATYRLTQTETGIVPLGSYDSWAVEASSQKQSNHVTRRFVGNRSGGSSPFTNVT